MNQTKQCTDCGEVKELELFTPEKRSKDGRSGRCKDCQSVINKAYGEANREKLRELNKAYREANKEKIIERKKAYAEANKEKIAEKVKAYKEANKEKLKETAKAYYEANKEKIVEKVKAYHQTEKGKMISIAKAHKRRAREKSTEDGTVTAEAIGELLQRQNNRCNDCGDEFNDQTPKHLDHHYPLARGGTHTLDNVVWLCQHCNQVKHATVPDEPLIIRAEEQEAS